MFAKYNLYKKCYNSNCLYCCEKYNIKHNVIKLTDNISLDDHPKNENKIYIVK